MSNMTNEQLIEVGKKVIANREKQKAYDRIYNGRIKWANEQYKAFAIAKGFKLPEYPDNLK